MCMSEVDSFRCLCFHFSLIWTDSLCLWPTDFEYLSLKNRRELSQKKKKQQQQKTKTKLQHYWEQQAQLYTAIFLAISEAWIKYVKITFFWDVLPSSSQYKMPLSPWRWRQQIPRKCQYHFTKLHGIIFKETVILIVGAVRISNVMLFKLLAITLL